MCYHMLECWRWDANLNLQQEEKDEEEEEKDRSAAGSHYKKPTNMNDNPAQFLMR